MAGDGLLPVMLFQDGTNAKFKARVSVGPTFAIVNPGSETPLFRVAPGVLLVFLAIQINEPDGKTPMEVVNQFCRVATDSQGVRSLVPTECWTAHAGSKTEQVGSKVVAKWKGRFHPRLSVGAASGHEFPFLVVDLTFVHATAFLARDPEMDPAYNKDIGPRPHHGCDLQALEFTHKDGPATWFVTVPPALNTAELNPMRPRGWSGGETSDRGARAFDVLVYLRPRLAKNGKLVTYTELGDTPLLGRLNRLVAVPKPEWPFFAGPSAGWNPGPSVSFEQQLIESGKKILVVHPWPSGINFGHLYTPNLRRTLDHVLTALRANGAISLGNVLDIQTARIGVAGYSGGGNEAIKVWKANHHTVDELYLLDPQSFAKDQAKGGTLLVSEKGAPLPALREWFKDDRRRLRMIGGLQHEMALFIANTLDPSWKKKLTARETSEAPAPRVWCKPTETTYRLGLGDDMIYSWALLPPPPKGGKFDAASLAAHRLSAPGATASSLTSDTGLELIEEKKPNEVAVRVTALTKDVKFPVSHAELAGFLRSVWVPGRPESGKEAPLPDEKEFWSRRQKNGNAKVVDEPTLDDLRNLVSLYLLHGRDRQESFNHDKALNRDKPPGIHRAFGVRHQWAASGGEKDPSRGAKFEGYFYLCLRDSAFRN